MRVVEGRRWRMHRRPSARCSTGAFATLTVGMVSHLRFPKCFGQPLYQMASSPARRLSDLVAAAGAHGHDLGLAREGAHGREERALADRLGDRVVLSLVA